MCNSLYNKYYSEGYPKIPPVKIYINSIDIVKAYNHINYKFKYVCGYEILYYNSLLSPRNWKPEYDIREILKEIIRLIDYDELYTNFKKTLNILED